MRNYLKLKGAIAALFWLLIVPTSSAGETIIQVFDVEQQPVPNVVVIVPGIKLATARQQQPVIDQINEQFSPQLLVVGVGSEVAFPNSDKTRHHVYSFSPAKVFELPLYSSSDDEVVTFDTPGMVHLGCNIHDQMKATLIVSDDHVFAVSDVNGTVRLPITVAELPKQVQVWHQQIGHEEPLGYPIMHPVTRPIANPLKMSDDSVQADVQIGLDFVYVAPQEKPRKLTLKERLEKYKNK